LFLEENILWGELFVNIWYNNLRLQEIAIQNIIGLLETKDFFIINAVIESVLQQDSLDGFYIFDNVLSNKFADVLVNCLEIKNHILAKILYLFYYLLIEPVIIFLSYC